MVGKRKFLESIRA